jgi:hypothetical protein
MKKLTFALVGAATLALAACGGRDEDSVENLDANIGAEAEQLNSLADDAANEAEAEALGVQQEQLESEAPAAENEAESGAADVEPTEDPDENVSGM